MSKRNFRNKSKKQPLKRQLLKVSETRRKLEQELDEAFELKKNNQLLNANLRSERETAQEASRNAMKREEKAERLHQYAEQELRRVNKYHPTLMSPEYIDGGIGPVTVSDALSYRLVAPHIDWDDQRQVGAVKMIIGKAPGQSEQVAYAISEGSIRHLTDHMFEEVAKDMGNQIALELLRLAKTQLRK